MTTYDLARLKQIYGNGRERGALLAMSKQAAKAERYEDVTNFMRELIRVNIGQSADGQQSQQQSKPNGGHSHSSNTDLSDEERNLLVTGYKHVLGDRRSAWRALRSMMEVTVQPYTSGGQAADAQQPQHGFTAGNITLTSLSVPFQQLPANIQFSLQLMDDYKQHIEADLQALTADVIRLIDSTLLRSVQAVESKAFYLKFVADCYRYIAEMQPQPYGDQALHQYIMAYQLATQHLEPTHPTRLGIALNYSVLLCEVKGDRVQACEVAKHAFDMAIAKLDELEETSYKSSTLLMQLLRDNTTLWSAHDNGEQ